MFVQLKTSRRSLGLFVFAFAACLANLPLARSKVALDPVGIYGSIAHAQECLFITWNAAAQGLSGASIPSCLRFAFHDGATYQTTTDEGGANGSIMKELDFTLFPEHNGMQPCANVMQTILDQARANGCPELTAADGIQVSGAVSVSVSGGPTCDLLMGRPDQLFADDCTVLPHEYECNDAITLITSFTLNGFTDPTTSLVVLSGSHNIAHSRVTESSGCSRGKGPFTVGSKNFDGHYYNEVVDQTGREGWLASDRTLADGDNPTVPLMATFARNHSAFLEAWCPHYREMSLLGVNVSAVETDLRITSGWSPSGINPVEAAQPSYASSSQPPLVGLNPPAAHEVPAYGGSPPTYGSPSNASPAILNATPQGGAPPASGGPPKKAPPSSMPNASPQGGGPGAGGGPPKKAPPAAIPNASPQGGALPASGGPPKKAPPPSMPNASPQGGAPPAGGGPSKKAPPAAIPNASPQGGGPPASGGPPKKAPSPAMPNASPQGGGPGARGGPSKKVPSPA